MTEPTDATTTLVATFATAAATAWKPVLAEFGVTGDQAAFVSALLDELDLEAIVTAADEVEHLRDENARLRGQLDLEVRRSHELSVELDKLAKYAATYEQNLAATQLDADAVLHTMRNGEPLLGQDPHVGRVGQPTPEEYAARYNGDWEGPEDDLDSESAEENPEQPAELEIVTSLYVFSEDGRPVACYVTLDEAKQAGGYKGWHQKAGIENVWTPRGYPSTHITRVPLAPPTTVLHRGTGLTDCAASKS